MSLRKSTFLWIAALMIFSFNVHASHPQQSQVVDGMAIYLAVMPAEMLRGHPNPCLTPPLKLLY